ncbi:MAG: ATP-dependent helicase [Trueperaceae bacterium]|nr:ATP-dependent helicase [Trueperaceae bacterium]
MIETLYAHAAFTPNEDQRHAIEHLDGPLFLVAGPGSGKTRVLLWRVVNMIAFHDVAPESVFLGTFTEKAAKQLRDGLVSLLALASERTGEAYDLSGMYVGTIHALCHRLLQDRPLAADRERSPVPAVLDELDQYFTLSQGSFWAEAVTAFGFEGEMSDFREKVNAQFEPPASASRYKAVVNLQSLFNRLSEEDVDPQAILEKVPEEHTPLFRLYELYRERLGDKRVDLSLLQRAAYRALLVNEGAIHRFKHVIIDEYQDTNTIQELIFFRLAAGWKNLCVVGDDDQALYRFRGATVENFVEFPKRCSSTLGVEPRRIELGINYRSRRGIVQAYTSFVAQHDWSRPDGGQFRLHDKGVRAHSKDDGVSVVSTAPSKPVELVDEIAILCRRLIDERVVADPNQIAFLFPTLKSTIVERFEEALGRVGLRVYAPRAKRFLEADEPTLVIGLLTRVLGKPHRNEAFDRGEYGEFHSWLDTAVTVADALMDSDPTLRAFVDQRVAELKAIECDYVALKAILDAAGWSEDAVYDPNTHKRPLLNAAGLSADARRALGGAGLEKLYRERLADENPISLKNVINRATTADWGLLDLFYRFLGFQRFREMIDLADGGVDEAPVCNLALTSQLLARYIDTFPPLITGQGLATEMLQRGFYQAFLFALFRMGEGEYEDAEDPFPRGRIPFLTIHQSKGLEFPVVVLGSARTQRRARKVEELVRPILPPGGEPLDRMPGFDAMRMFYVALSRAQNLLVLAHPKGQGQKVDTEFHELMAKAAPIAGFDVTSVPKAKQEPDDVVRRFSYTSDYLAFQRCPRQYMLFERYGFAASRTQTMFFGSLVHATLEDLHHRMIAARKAKKVAQQAGGAA